MKKILLVAVFFPLISLPGCKKDTVFMNSATIIGADARMSPCTGGIYIKIDGHPNSNDPINGYYDIDAMHAPFQLGALTKFPVRVELNWRVNSKCSGTYVDITKVKIVN